MRFVQHPWIAYLHIGPGILYLLGAPLQLSYRFRSRHYTFHRRLGRLLAGSALLSGIFALAFGILFPFGGIIEVTAVVVFGLWFLTCLTLAIRAIRGDDMVHHRRWMIRAFAVGARRSARSGSGSASSRASTCSTSTMRSRRPFGSPSACTPSRPSCGCELTRTRRN